MNRPIAPSAVSDDYLTAAHGALVAFCTSVGLNCCVYDFSAVLKGSIPDVGYRLHRHPFCMAVKGPGKAMNRCVAQDHRKASLPPAGDGVPPAPCHGGVREWVAPFRVDGRLMGAIMAGPFRLDGDPPPPSTPAEKHWKHVPVLTPGRFADLDRQLRFFAKALEYHLEKSEPPPQPGVGSPYADALAAVAFFPNNRPAPSPRIRQVIEILKTNFTDEIDFTGLCATLEVSPSHFSRVFRHEMGQPFRTYVKNMKLSYGAELLRRTPLPAQQVGALCGYGTPIAFSLAFRLKYRVSPGVYRKRNMP